MKKRIAFLFALFLFTSPAFAQFGVTSYKLGNVYHSEHDEDIKCLEGSMGFVMQTKECHGQTAGKCSSNAECKGQGGAKYYYCSKITKTCQYQDCTSTAISPVAGGQCFAETGHMRSCVANENGDGGKHCETTCSWEMIKTASGFSQEEINAIASRLKLDMEVWKKPTQALSFYKSLNFDKNNPDGNALGLYNDYRGLVRTCLRGSSTQNCSPSYTNVNMIGHPYCMTCSMLTGGTWGKTEDFDLGTYPRWYSSDKDVLLYGRRLFEETLNPYTVQEYGCRNTDTSVPLLYDYPVSSVGKMINNFQKVADTQQLNDFSNVKELAPLLKVPEFYYLGAKPICAYYDKNRKDASALNRPYDTLFMLYIPAQEAVSVRELKDDVGAVWDFRDRDRIACCSNETYASKTSGEGWQAMKCIELDSSNSDVIDMAD